MAETAGTGATQARAWHAGQSIAESWDRDWARRLDQIMDENEAADDRLSELADSIAQGVSHALGLGARTDPATTEQPEDPRKTEGTARILRACWTTLAMDVEGNLHSSELELLAAWHNQLTGHQTLPTRTAARRRKHAIQAKPAQTKAEHGTRELKASEWLAIRMLHTTWQTTWNTTDANSTASSSAKRIGLLAQSIHSLLHASEAGAAGQQRIHTKIGELDEALAALTACRIIGESTGHDCCASKIAHLQHAAGMSRERTRNEAAARRGAHS